MVYIFYTLAVFITILYWWMLYDSSSPPSYSNLFVHGLQATPILLEEYFHSLLQGVFVVVDQFISNRKWHLEKIYLCLPVPLVYVIFNVTYWAAGGMVNGEKICIKTTLRVVGDACRCSLHLPCAGLGEPPGECHAHHPHWSGRPAPYLHHVLASHPSQGQNK